MKATEDVDRAPRGWGAAMPTESGFSFDGLVNPLRLGSARIAMETRDSPAIYIAFDVHCLAPTIHWRLSIQQEQPSGSPQPKVSFRRTQDTVNQYSHCWEVGYSETL
jgi:hypothetical protein